MFHPNQFVDVVAAALGLAEDGGAVAVGKLRRARENPEVAVGAAANEHVAVVGIDEHDAIVGVERAEEGDAQHGRGVGGLGFALRGLGFAIFDAGVGHGNLAVCAQRVIGFAVLQSALKAMVETGNLVPVTQIFVQVEFFYH